MAIRQMACCAFICQSSLPSSRETQKAGLEREEGVPGQFIQGKRVEWWDTTGQNRG